MLRTEFELLLKNRLLVIEGSLNAEVSRRTQSGSPCLPRMVLEQGELLKSIQLAYAEAGAHILVAPTSQANSVQLRLESLEKQMAEINHRAIDLSRSVCRVDGYVFAGIGTTGALLKPYGTLDASDYRDIYSEQGQMLLTQQPDGFILEGFGSLIEAENCVLALRRLCSLPIIATMTFLEDGRTRFGDSMASCFKGLLEKGADIVGIHGTLGPLEIDNFLAQLSDWYPLSVRPNAGYPVKVGQTTTYLSSPEYVAEFAGQFVKRGVNILGGAAGFTPNHIAEVARSLKGKRPFVPARITQDQQPTTTKQVQQKQQPGKLASIMGTRPILSIEIEPPHGLDIQSVLGLLGKLKPMGVDAVNIPENPLARARISSIALARVIWDELEIESIAHMTCRDRNLISLQAELLGAHVLGINNILALTGDPSAVGDYPTATSIFDVDSLGLVEIMVRMNMGKDFGMNDLGALTSFNIGVAANPIAADMDIELRRLEAKIGRGASFIQTQPIFDPTLIEPFLKAVAPFGVPVLFGVMPVRDYRHAKYLVNEFPGIRIPEDDLQRFQSAGAKRQKEISIALTRRLIRDLYPRSGGVYLMPGFGDTAVLVDVMADLIFK